MLSRDTYGDDLLTHPLRCACPVDLLQENAWNDYRPFEGIDYNFFSVFGVFFPAVTGIVAGANLSGDLKVSGPAGGAPWVSGGPAGECRRYSGRRTQASVVTEMYVCDSATNPRPAKLRRTHTCVHLASFSACYAALNPSLVGSSGFHLSQWCFS